MIIKIGNDITIHLAPCSLDTKIFVDGKSVPCVKSFELSARASREDTTGSVVFVRVSDPTLFDERAVIAFKRAGFKVTVEDLDSALSYD